MVPVLLKMNWMQPRYMKYGMMGIGLLMLSCGQPGERTRPGDGTRPAESGRPGTEISANTAAKISADTAAVYREFEYCFELLNSSSQSG